MPQYEIIIGDWATIIEASTKADAQAWADVYRPNEPNTVTEIPTVAKTDVEKLIERKMFGAELVDIYLLDNDAIAAARGEPLSVAESNQQAAKFQAIMGVLPIGSLRQALAIIQATPTDTIFTQQRKDKYIALLTNFLASQ